MEEIIEKYINTEVYEKKNNRILLTFLGTDSSLEEKDNTPYQRRLREQFYQVHLL